MLPYIKFYPQDWLADPNVRSLTLFEQGAFINLLCLSWVRASGCCSLPDDPAYLAKNLNISVLVARNLRNKLVSNKLLISENGQLVSKRLALEHDEGVRKASRRSRAGEQGARKRLENLHRAQANAEHLPTTTEPAPTTEVKHIGLAADFEVFWAAYPRKVKKPNAARAFSRINIPVSNLISSLEKWKLCEQWQNIQYIPHPATWLNGRQFEDEPAPSSRKQPDRVGANVNNNGHYVNDARYCSKCNLPQMSSVCIRCGAELLTNSQTLFGDI